MRQCKLLVHVAGDGPEAWPHFATKLKDCCGVVEHLGYLHASASELAVTAGQVMATKGVVELA